MNFKVAAFLQSFGDRFKCRECDDKGYLSDWAGALPVKYKCPHCKDTGGYDSIVYRAFEKHFNTIEIIEYELSHGAQLPPQIGVDLVNRLKSFLSKLEDGEQ